MTTETHEIPKIPHAESARLASIAASLQAALAEARDVDLRAIQPPLQSGDWSLAPDALRLLVSLVHRLKPRHILEFGSGLSTRVLAWACADSGLRCRITSVDHDPQFHRTVLKELRQQSLKCPVTCLFAPLVARDCAGNTLPMYRLPRGRLASRRAADLVVVDGPPLLLGGREGMLYQAMSFARPGTLLLLDDAERVEERRALTRWQDMFCEAIEIHSLPGFRKGLAAVLIREPVPTEDLDRHRLQIASRELSRVIPEGALFALVDENQWLGSNLAPGRRAVLFLEQDGCSWGPPVDDRAALQELDHLLRAGVSFVVFGWPAAWWLDHYAGLRQRLRSQFRCVLENNRLVVFDLRQGCDRLHENPTFAEDRRGER